MLLRGYADNSALLGSSLYWSERIPEGRRCAGYRAIRGSSHGIALGTKHFRDKFTRWCVVFHHQDRPCALFRGLRAGVARNRVQQSGFVDRFHQIFVGSEQRSHARLIDDRNYDHGNVRCARIALQLDQDFPAILRLHHYVEGDGARLELRRNIQGLLRLFAERHLVSRGGELRLNQLRGHPIIFNHQNSRGPERSRSRFRFASEWFSGGGNCGKREIETASLAYLTLQAQLTAMQFNQALSDGQSQSSPFRFLAGFPEPVESLENAPFLFGRYTRAVVPHFNANAAATQMGGEFDS